jgi:UDP-glucose 4-epimerase
MKKILITGGAGYIGRYLTYYLIKNKYKVFVVDNLINSKKIHFNKNFNFLRSTFESNQTLNLIKKNNIRTIIHLAAYIDSEESLRLPKKYYQNNFFKLNIFLKKLSKLKIDNFLFASTASVYGDNKNNFLKENSKKIPKTPYGISKRKAEILIKKYSKLKKFNYSILRFFNVCGTFNKIDCGPTNNSYKHIFNKIVKLKKFIINGNDYLTKDGTCERDYINVKDVGRIVYNVLNKHAGQNLIINCGTGIATSVLEIAKSYKQKVNKKLIITLGPRRNGDPSRVISDNSKLKKILKFSFLHSSLNQIILDYKNWAR